MKIEISPKLKAAFYSLEKAASSLSYLQQENLNHPALDHRPIFK